MSVKVVGGTMNVIPYLESKEELSRGIAWVGLKHKFGLATDRR